jgi:hypothetical protein
VWNSITAFSFPNEFPVTLIVGTLLIAVREKEVVMEAVVRLPSLDQGE